MRRGGRVLLSGLVLLAALGWVGSSGAGAGAEGNEAPGAPWAFRSLAAGFGHSCALAADGSVKCWGYNALGQLGVGDIADRGDGPGEMGSALPVVDLGPGRSATAITAGNEHTCAVLDDGSVKCWGSNIHGQLGVGDIADRGDGPGEMGSALPVVDLGPGRSATAITAGRFHTCAVLDDGSVKCWGWNLAGQLGVGDTADRGDEPGEMGSELPVVDLGAGRSATAISAGANHSCAVLDDGSVKCWGWNDAGQLGVGDTALRGDGPGEMGSALPVVDLGPGRSATAISAGDEHSCAVLDDGSVKCWGENGFGQLGVGDTAWRGDGPGEMGSALPVVDLEGRSATAISAGGNHSCAVLDDGSVKCWGWNVGGQLGLGDTADRGDGSGEMGAALPAVDLGAGRSATAITASDSHSCALFDDGSLKCWGQNFAGQLGVGDNADRGDGPGEMGSALPVVDLGPSPAPRLRADYRFLRSRVSSAVAAPNLTDVGPGTNAWARERVATPLRSVLRFPEGNGVDLPTLSSVVPDDHYTVAVLFRIDELDNVDLTGYERIVQWSDDASESGLYVHEGRMEFYPRQSDEATGEAVGADEWVQVTVTRSRIGRLRVYLDGVPTLDFSDNAREGVVSAADVLRFFRDDTEEDTSGAVARLRLWNRPMSPTAVAALTELPPAATVTPSRASAAQQALIEVQGRNFGPLEQVRITIRDRRGLTRTLGTPRSDRSGAVRRSVRIPAALANGDARITATGLTSQLAPRVSIRIT